MAEQQPSNALAAAFPSPPPFYQHFTSENLDRIAALRAFKHTEGSDSALVLQSTGSESPTPKAAIRLFDLPPGLRFLQPPEPPAQGIFRSFGDVFNLHEGLPSLTEQGIDQLYTPPGTPSPSGSGSHTDRALILKRIAKSLLLNFLELVGIMSVNPEHAAEKIQDLRTLFINFHHLLNEYRPHQARESLIMMMEDQLERSKNEIEGIERMKMKVDGILKGLGQPTLADRIEEGEQPPALKGSSEDDVAGEDVWEELYKEFP